MYAYHRMQRVDPRNAVAEWWIRHWRRRVSYDPVTTLAIAAALVLSSSGIMLWLNAPPDYEKLRQESNYFLRSKRYALALPRLQKLAAGHPKDASVFLSLARAFFGVDQAGSGWKSISRAQQLGLAIGADSELAAEMSSYFRQRKNYRVAFETLRPLAMTGAPERLAELATLLNLWGEEAHRAGDAIMANHCWREAQRLREQVAAAGSLPL